MVWQKPCLRLLILLFPFFSWSLSFKTEQIKIKTSSGKTPIKIKVAVADDVEKRTQGLMFVENWTKYQGMLFVFPHSRTRVFWMKNTLLPLSIGFFDQSKKLIHIAKLNPAKSLAQKEVERARSPKAAQFVLEMPQGWYEKNKVGLGASLELPKTVSPKD
jgi:hypothetical protein